MKVSMRIILQTPTRVTLGSRYTPALPRALSQCSEPGPGSPPASGRTAPAVPPPGPAEQRAAPSARRLPPFPKNKTSPLLRPAFGALSGKPLRDAGEGRGRLDPSPPGTEAGAGAGGPHLALGQAEPPAGGGPASPGRRLPSRDAARRSEQRPRPGGCGPDAGAPVRPSPGGGGNSSTAPARSRQAGALPSSARPSVRQCVHSREEHVWTPGAAEPASPADRSLRTHLPHGRRPAAPPPGLRPPHANLARGAAAPQPESSQRQGDTTHARCGPGRRPRGMLGAEVLRL